MAEPRILLVEDNHINQVVAQKILAKIGLTADVAESGEDALEKLSTASYALVLMDVRLPGMDGIETSQRIRSQESPVRDHAVPIIALTAYASDEDRATCITAGMNDYLSKPLDINTFLETVQRYVSPDGHDDGDDTGAATSRGDSEDARSAQSPGSIRHSEQPLFDSDRLYRQLSGDAKLAHTAIATFLGLLDRKLRRLQEAAETGDLDEVYRLAHSLAGAAGNVAAEALQHQLRSLEVEAGDGNREQVRSALPPLNELAEQTRTALNAFQS
jgi:CheY-like chemotaxis protein/HPt (histidine-containing phosphotransfer) domain-containing protein